MSNMSPRSCLPSLRSLATSQTVSASIMAPCPTSPNMTANRNGKVAMVNTAGFTSRYRAMPYASTCICRDAGLRTRLFPQDPVGTGNGASETI